MLTKIGEELWDFSEYRELCVDGRHGLRDRGKLSTLVQMLAETEVERTRVMAVWSTLGNLDAWWCYACSEWGYRRTR